ncbi:50S ribosomal protein L10 [Candidatus Parcubacteria bacterium]|nr:50S ribosomal protein L10 [Patescibacteria group bacterium]MBU4466804.1 50S ribosomal protein L10 [Patescibacteria group bacterium]MCG2688448.1 50S ribosomal protein L10 [Candidatus Parcubacteria bacterium]
MPKTKEQKTKVIQDLSESLAKAKSIVFIDIQGLKVREIVSLRKKAKQAMGNLKVAKKSLIDLAIKSKKGIADKVSAKTMSGEIAVLFGFDDPIKPLKSFYEFAKANENLKFISAILDDNLLNKEEVMAIAQLPSKQELLGQLLSTFNGPISGFINVLRGNIKGLITVLAKAKT